MHPVCPHNKRGVLAESSLTYRERHSASKQQVTEFRLSLSSVRPATTSLARGLAQAGLASALAGASCEVEAEVRGRLTFVLHTDATHRHRATHEAPEVSPSQARVSGHRAMGDGEEQLAPARKFRHHVCA